MSTEIIKETLDNLKGDLVEYINDECLDITDLVSADVFAVQVIKIAQRLVFFKESRPQMSVHGVIGNIDKGIIYNVKVNNTHGGFVSVSDDDCTGVSRTQFYPFYCDNDSWFTGLCELASMINEAWYHCNN